LQPILTPENSAPRPHRLGMRILRFTQQTGIVHFNKTRANF